MNKEYKLEQSAQFILNIIEALSFYRDNAIKPKYRKLINEQLLLLGKQLKEQGLNVIINEEESQYKFGNIVKYDNQEAIIIGISNEDNFVKITTIKDNKFEIHDVPIILLEVENDESK
jgi:asparagine N-glycosylation enzyme membrane subunit Stt3